MYQAGIFDKKGFTVKMPPLSAAVFVLFLGCATAYSGVSDADSGRLAEQGLLVTREAATYIRTPYRSPANAPSSFDCSSFVSHVYSQFGYKLPTSTTAYSGVGSRIDWEDAIPGDILVFAKAKGSNDIDHVAILWKKSENGKLAGSWIIHAASINTGTSMQRGNPDTRTGVVITQLGLRGDGVIDNEYFYQRFIFCTRVLN